MLACALYWSSTSTIHEIHLDWDLDHYYFQYMYVSMNRYRQYFAAPMLLPENTTHCNNQEMTVEALNCIEE